MKNTKTRTLCQKRMLTKCKDVCRTYSTLQFDYATLLEQNDDVKEFICNYELVNLQIDGTYTTDFYIIKTNGNIMIRECVLKKHLAKPLTIKLLDISRDYWLMRGVADWGIITNESK